MLVIGFRQYYSEMECKKNHRRVMAACVRQIYDNVKNIIHLGRRPPRYWGPRLQPAKPIGKSGTGNSCVEGREVKCFNAIAGGEGPRFYIL